MQRLSLSHPQWQPLSATDKLDGRTAECVFLVDRDRLAFLRAAVPKDMLVQRARDSRDLARQLASQSVLLVVVDPSLLSPETASLMGADTAVWHVVVDTTMTVLGLSALWQLLTIMPAAVVLREHDGPDRIANAFAGVREASDELLRAWTPLLSKLPSELARAITAVTCGAATAESVDALAGITRRSRRWVELRIHDAAVGSAWRIVVASRIARAHADLIDPTRRSVDIAERHRFGDVRTLRSQIDEVVGVSVESVRAGMPASELADRIAGRMMLQ